MTSWSFAKEFRIEGEFINDARYCRCAAAPSAGKGYVRIRQVATDGELEALQRRIDDIMLGKAPLDYDQMLMHLTVNLAKMRQGHKGPTLRYRKIQNLEFDPLFLAYSQTPVLREVCAGVYGEGTPVACYRAMFMNKPAREGTNLDWHQDR